MRPPLPCASLIAEIAADLCARVNALEADRRGFLLDWLEAHHLAGGPVRLEGLQAYLENWFGTLEPAGVVWEYRLLLEEIAWWRGLKADALVRFTGGNLKDVQS